MSHMSIILSLYKATILWLNSSTRTAIVSANFESLFAGMRIFLTPYSIFAFPKGGGFGRVIMCSRVLGWNTRITPSEQPQNKWSFVIVQLSALSTFMFIHFWSFLFLSKIHRCPSIASENTYAFLQHTPTNIFTFTLVKSADLLSIILSLFAVSVFYTLPLSSKYQNLRCSMPPVTKKSPFSEKHIVVTGLPSLLEVTRYSFCQSHTNRPLSFVSPSDIKYCKLGENRTLSMPYL